MLGEVRLEERTPGVVLKLHVISFLGRFLVLLKKRVITFFTIRLMDPFES